MLVGNSLGGAICQVAAAARPERVCALVLACSASPQSRIPWSFRLLRAPILGELEMELLIRPVMEYGMRHRLFARPESVTVRMVEQWWTPIPVPGTRRAALAAIRSSPRGYENLLEGIRVPTLVLWGMQDKLLPAEEGRRLASEIAGAELALLPGAGHVPQEERPREFSRVVASFLAEIARRESGSASSEPVP